MDRRSIAKRGCVYALALTSLSACNSLNSMLEPDRIDYKSAGKAQTPSLEVPPDLTQLQRDNRYAIPEAAKGSATASGYNSQQQGVRSSASAQVAPSSVPQMRIERAGTQRWLVVRQTPEQLWPQIKDFWQESGFLVNIDSPAIGVMETDWAENRAKIPQDIIRNTLGRVLDSFYSTGERDKFRTRLERSPDGSTEIYISHRGAQEVLVGSQKDGTVWTPRAPDPELEAEFLTRLMTRLGADNERAKFTVASAPAQPNRAKLVKAGSNSLVEVDESFDRAWRRVGLALDRVGFTVEDRDRSNGVYFVRYVDQGQDAQNKPNAEKGFFAKLFHFGDDKAKLAQRYRISVKEAGSASRISVLNNDGRPEQSATGDKILTLLNEQLK